MPNDQPDWTSVIGRPQTQLAGSPWAYGTGSNTLTFTLAPDTSIVCILLPNFFNVTSLLVVGHTSGFTYVKAEPLKTSFHPYYVAAINSAVDTQVDVTVAAGVANTAYVSSIPDPVAAITLPNQPAPWEAPNQPMLDFAFNNPGAATDVIVIPAPSNAQSIWLHSVFYIPSAANATMAHAWQDSAGTPLWHDTFTTDVSQRRPVLHGVKMAGGKSLNFHQIGAAVAGTISIQGGCVYSVY